MLASQDSNLQPAALETAALPVELDAITRCWKLSLQPDRGGCDLGVIPTGDAEGHLASFGVGVGRAPSPNLPESTFRRVVPVPSCVPQI